MSSNEKNIPKRRFKEFLEGEAWEERKLGDVVDVFSGRDYKHLSEGSIPVYGTGGYMLSVNEALSYDKDAIGIGRKGTIDKPYVLKAPFWTVDTLFYAIPKEQYNLDFVFNIFQLINWKGKDESTGVPSLSKTAINDVDIFIPKSLEQEKIGAHFHKIDNLITLHQRKLDKLKVLKKAYLAQMFPSVGESKPRLRFSGFNDDWEQRKLGELCDVYDGTHQTPNYRDGGIMFLSVENINTLKSQKYISEEDFIKEFNIFPEKGDVLMTRIGDIGTANVVESNEPKAYYVSLALLKKKLLNPYFLKESISSKTVRNDIWKRTLHIAFPKKINKNEITEVMILYPQQIDEQEQIGIFFKNFDNLITLHQRKLEKLQNIKKAYLNEMFV